MPERARAPVISSRTTMVEKNDSLCFVQFLHPGGEHKPDKQGWKDWNKDPDHKRKFVKNPGSYVKTADSSRNDCKHDTLTFWCEWEPPSYVKTINKAPLEPQYLHTPCYTTPSHNAKLKNTDPFVFGKNFLYSNCKQFKKNGKPTQLRYLERGSVILFGSKKNDKFVLDTVFVVDKCKEYTLTKYDEQLKELIKDDLVRESFKNTTIIPLYWELGDTTQDKLQFRLYSGATIDSKIDNTMFSFFPAQLYEDKPKGFNRPEITLKGIISGTQSQWYKLNRDNKNNLALWRKVADQVSKKLLLGIQADLPSYCNPV